MVDVGDQLVLHVLLARLKHRIDFDLIISTAQKSTPGNRATAAMKCLENPPFCFKGKAGVGNEANIKKNDKLLVSITKSLDRCAYR